MTQDIAEHLRKLTSRNGRYWLRDSRNNVAAETTASEDLPFRSVATGSNRVSERPSTHESIVVSIPNVADVSPTTPATPQSQAAQTATAAVEQSIQSTAQLPSAEYQMGTRTRVVAPLPNLHPVQPAANAAANVAAAPTVMPTIPQIDQLQTGHAGPAASMVDSVTEMAAAQVAAKVQAKANAPASLESQTQEAIQTATQRPTPTLVSAEKVLNLDLQELAPPAKAPVAPTPSAAPFDLGKPSPKGKIERTEGPHRGETDDAVAAARATQTQETKDSIAKIADEVIARFPVASSSIVMIAGSQASLHSDETCARVAAELASRGLGRVLLVDSDFNGRRLTKASGMSAQGGLSEVMNIAYPWRDAVLKSGSSKLDFMAAGSCPHKRWTPKSQLREAIAEIRSEYQFVCVSVGDAHSSASSLWSEMSDGAFLVVSATQSCDAVAESAVSQMRDDGARLVGCIVADVVPGVQ
ncbi:tyrosine-protein kinase family protein [Mariniblastus fucicola]|uniref:Tyrosine-protein kinase YwqD n=1 Tax=Mariniblastus fucicola TaxID=980251 RepID=A0A5B9P693_9BACT|nr:hypothetical protein [Mariniblastus fucicola]QEG21848.1 hypothetical protein MFFC18_17090 [Mariniblastus fucicola]